MFNECVPVVGFNRYMINRRIMNSTIRVKMSRRVIPRFNDPNFK